MKIVIAFVAGIAAVYLVQWISGAIIVAACATRDGC